MGCFREVLRLDSWKPSQNDFDWLGHGIDLWEHAPARAWRWAEEKTKGTGEEAAVIGAIIQLGDCFDLTNEKNTANLGRAYELIRASYEETGNALPQNRGTDADLKGRFLDCLIINYYLRQVPQLSIRLCVAPFAKASQPMTGP